MLAIRQAIDTYPFETFIKTVTRGGASRLNVPSPLSQRVETKLVGDFGSIHGVGKILIVRRSGRLLVPVCWQRPKVVHLSIHLRSTCVALGLLVDHRPSRPTLFARLGDTLPVVRINHKDDTLSVLEILRVRNSHDESHTVSP